MSLNLIFVLVLLCAGILSMGLAKGAESVISPYDQFVQVRQLFYQGNIRADEFTDQLSALKTELVGSAPERDQYYLLALIEFLTGEFEEERGEEAKAAQAFMACGDWAKKTLELDKQFSEGYRVLADSYMRLTAYNGLMYTMTKGAEARSLLTTSLELDRTNYSAHNSLGVYYLNAPAIGGGSVPKAIKSLKQALKSTDQHENFLSYLWLARAYERQQKWELAEEAQSKALLIYP